MANGPDNKPAFKGKGKPGAGKPAGRKTGGRPPFKGAKGVSRPYRGEGDARPRRDDRDEAPRGEGGYAPRAEGSRGPRAEGGFKPRGEGGYAPRAEGSRGPRTEGGFKPRSEGGYAPRSEGSRGPRPEGGFKPRSEGGFKPRSEGGYAPRSEGSRGPRPEGGFKPRGEGGYAPRSEGSRGPRPEGGFKPRGEGGYAPRSESGSVPRGEFKPPVRGDVNPREDFKEMDREFNPSARGPRYHGPDNAVNIGDGSILGVYTEREEDEGRIEGRNPVLEAFKAGHEMNKVILEKDTEDATLLKIAGMARDNGVPVLYVDRRKLDAMSMTRAHQGVIVEVAAHEYVEVEDILAKAAEKNEPAFLVVLDGVTDPNNLGSVIRSAECAGAHGVIIPKRRAVALNATVAKVSAGAHEHLPVARVSNLVSTLKTLKEQGLWIAAADAGAEKIYTDTDLKGPLALVVGGEGEGISRIVLKECDLQVKIPMCGSIDSLNAGVAAALMLFEVRRQRG